MDQTRATALRARIERLETALDKLLCGELVTSLSHSLAGTNSLTRAAPNAAALREQISELKAELRRAEGLGARPIHFT